MLGCIKVQTDVVLAHTCYSFFLFFLKNFPQPMHPVDASFFSTGCNFATFINKYYAALMCSFGDQKAIGSAPEINAWTRFL